MNKTIIAKLGGVFVAGVMSFAIVSCNKIEPEFFTIKNDKGLEVTFCDRGASIYSIYYEGLCVTYQPEDHEEFFNDTCGKILGRTSGRIENGKMKIGDKNYQFDVNETNKGKNNTLHGGKDGLSNKDFKHEIKESNGTRQVVFTYTSPNGESGYPGTVDFKITYTMPNDSDTINIDMLGTPRTNDPTPICLSNHTYWRLGGTNGIKDHKLKIPANNIANSRRKDQVIEPNPIDIVGASDWHKAFDFTTLRTIEEKDIEQHSRDLEVVAANDPLANGYDHGWIFNESGDNTVELENPETKVHIDVTTDIDMVFIYAKCWPIEGNTMLVYGDDEQYGGVSIEPMVYFNNANYNSILHTKDNPFHNHIVYTLSHDVQE